MPPAAQLICVLLSTLVLSACGAGGRVAVGARNRGAGDSPDRPTIDAAELFSDQGTLFDRNPQPSVSDPVAVTLRAGHGNVTSANIEYYDTADGAFHYVHMHVAATDPTGKYDYWEGKIPAGAAKKYYRFEVGNGTQTLWYNADGVSRTEPAAGNFFIIPGFDTPDWMKNGVMYEIFVDRFFDGDPGNDVTNGQYSYAGCATERHAWGRSVYAIVSGCNAEVFFGGDLTGIDQKLSYIKRTLGADIVYLTPIFQAPSNHKYDTANYDEVDPAFGTNAELETLIHDVHGRVNGPPGYIILDGVFNHTGDSSCWFGRETYGTFKCSVIGADQSQSSLYYSWYTFQDWPRQYSNFLSLVPTMPKLNYGASGSPVRRRIYGNATSVVQTYLRTPYGIDGWRLDSAQLLDADGNSGSDATNHQIMRELRTAVLSVNPNAEILGEFWGDPTPWLDGGHEWDGAMNYNGFTDPLSQWLCGVDEGGKSATLDVSEFDAALRSARADLPVNVQETMTNELGTHDTPRFTTRCGNDLAKTELAMVFQFTYVGTPAIYYGDEYGMHGANDPDDRRTFDWSRATLSDPPVALAHRLIEIRNTYPALRTGSFMTLLANDADDVYAYGRFDANNRIAVVLNASAAAHRVTVPVGELSMTDGSTVRALLAGGVYTVVQGAVTVNVAADSGVILEQ